jgi:hypothetical protein
MKSLTAWCSARPDVRGDRPPGTEPSCETNVLQLIAQVVDVLFSSIVEARILMFHRKQSEGIQNWAQQQNIAMESALDRSVRRVKERIVRGVSENLVPLLQRHIEQKSLEDFLAAVDAQTLDTAGETVRICLPSSLAEAATDELMKRNLKVVVIGESEKEIIASIAETRIESRIGETSSKAEDLLTHG